MTQHVDSTTGNKVDKLNSTDKASHAFEQGLGAGERNVDSATDGYQVVREECNVAVISKTGAVTIGAGAAGDTHLLGLMITAALTGTCTIAGFDDSDGTAQTITLPAATPAGFIDFKGAINAAGALVITASNGSDDNLISVLWKAA
jgi:hypothetical protein